MRKADLKTYEVRLQELGERLKGTVDQLDQEIVQERTAQGDIAHFGTHNADHDTGLLEVDEVAERNEVKLLNAVEAALARIERGSYGYCEKCGKELPRARLDAIPYAACCAGCEA